MITKSNIDELLDGKVQKFQEAVYSAIHQATIDLVDEQKPEISNRLFNQNVDSK